MSGNEWHCPTCTFHHRFAAQRCSMCGNLRTTKAQMRDFIAGKLHKTKGGQDERDTMNCEVTDPKPNHNNHNTTTITYATNGSNHSISTTTKFLPTNTVTSTTSKLHDPQNTSNPCKTNRINPYLQKKTSSTQKNDCSDSTSTTHSNTVQQNIRTDSDDRGFATIHPPSSYSHHTVNSTNVSMRKEGLDRREPHDICANTALIATKDDIICHPLKDSQTKRCQNQQPVVLSQVTPEMIPVQTNDRNVDLTKHDEAFSHPMSLDTKNLDREQTFNQGNAPTLIDSTISTLLEPSRKSNQPIHTIGTSGSSTVVKLRFNPYQKNNPKTSQKITSNVGTTSMTSSTTVSGKKQVLITQSIPQLQQQQQQQQQKKPLIPSLPLQSGTNPPHVGPKRISSSIKKTTSSSDNPFTKANPRFDVPGTTNADEIFAMVPTKDYEAGPVPLDLKHAKTWIFPISDKYGERKYQLDICQTAILHNTLVSLPTGLGKTLIAAVVMYNFYRWFPTGKIVFLAPTRPLVSQQIDACYKVMKIPERDTAEISGKSKPATREGLWSSRRVFFGTPQTFQKDIEEGRCDAKHIVCVCFDEAHKATGKYAYANVVEMVEKAGARFRVLALSATPGKDLKTIKMVIAALKISKIEARFENDPDVKPYVHDRTYEVIQCTLPDAVAELDGLLVKIIDPVLNQLRSRGALHLETCGNANITAYQLIQSRKNHNNKCNDHSLDQQFLIAYSLVTIRDRLLESGIGVARNALKKFRNDFGNGTLGRQIIQSATFSAIWESMTASPVSSAVDTGELAGRSGNPKLQKLEEILMEHFLQSHLAVDETRAIVFSQWRDSVEEIVNVLNTTSNLIKAAKFVGQSTGSSNLEFQLGEEYSNSGRMSPNKKNCIKANGMNQVEQQKVLRNFRDGVFNVLVCTCIGEEGLDICEVDLIVNFDCLRSPIRMVQRTGRTGRNRNGRVVCLVSKGREEKKLAKSEEDMKRVRHGLKKLHSFPLISYHALLPFVPLLERKVMNTSSSSCRLSQVGGYAQRKQNHNQSAEKSSGYLVNEHVWKLNEVQDLLRRERFGDIRVFDRNKARKVYLRCWQERIVNKHHLCRASTASMVILSNLEKKLDSDAVYLHKRRNPKTYEASKRRIQACKHGSTYSKHESISYDKVYKAFIEDSEVVKIKTATKPCALLLGDALKESSHSIVDGPPCHDPRFIDQISIHSPAINSKQENHTVSTHYVDISTIAYCGINDDRNQIFEEGEEKGNNLLIKLNSSHECKLADSDSKDNKQPIDKMIESLMIQLPTQDSSSDESSTSTALTKSVLSSQFGSGQNDVGIIDSLNIRLPTQDSSSDESSQCDSNEIRSLSYPPFTNVATDDPIRTDKQELSPLGEVINESGSLVSFQKITPINHRRDGRSKKRVLFLSSQTPVAMTSNNYEPIMDTNYRDLDKSLSPQEKKLIQLIDTPSQDMNTETKWVVRRQQSMCRDIVVGEKHGLTRKRKYPGEDVLYFLDLEAEEESDGLAGNDEDEEEDELIDSQDSFINDTSQLGYTQSGSPGYIRMTELNTHYAASEINIHRQVDNMYALKEQFATPVLRRKKSKRIGKMKRSFNSSFTQTQELDGIGNLHFIRSIIDYHRQGGNADDLERDYRALCDGDNQSRSLLCSSSDFS